VDKCFQFDIDPFLHFPDPFEGHLAGQVDPRDPLAPPEVGALPVGGVGLGRKVERAFGGDLGDHLDHPGVGGDVGIERDRRHLFQVAVKRCDIGVVRIAVDGEVDLYPPVVGVADPLHHFRRGEIVREVAQAIVLPPQVDGVRTVMDGDPEFFQVPGRGEEFGFLHCVVPWMFGWRYRMGCYLYSSCFKFQV
jgi:hypothetical protein